MRLFDGRCPRCTSPRLFRSGKGWLRFPARLVFLYPLRCQHCRNRFWRFRWNPPPVGEHRDRASTARD